MKAQPVNFAVMLMDIELPAGGGFQQAINDCKVLTAISQDHCNITYVTNVKVNVQRLEQFGKPVVYLPLSSLRKLSLWMRSKISFAKALKLVSAVFGQNYLDSFLSKHSIDLVHFVNPSRLANFLEKHPYTTTVWDLCHRDELDFPEVRSDREFERRESFYKTLLPKATAILVDSPESRQKLSHRYGVDLNRVEVMPFLPAPRIEGSDSKASSITEKYILYPAQLWPHKNHAYILRALKILKDQGTTLHAVFCGGDRDGSQSRLKKLSESLGVSEQIHWMGFVPDEDVIGLFKKAEALVMPTYFGPTNLPPLEAFQYKVPVIYSNIEGSENFLKDAALYTDLSNPKSLADHLYNLLNNPELKQRLVSNGERRLEEIKAYDRVGTWTKILNTFQSRLSAWKDS